MFSPFYYDLLYNIKYDIVCRIWGGNFLSSKRLFGILYYLSHTRKATTTELASHFEVSTRTINRDIDKLSVMEIPVYTEMGRNGGIYLLDSFILDKVLLSKEEQEHLLLTLKGTKNFNPMVGEKTLEKLKGLFVGEIEDWLEVDLSSWYSVKKGNVTFDLLRKSILNKERIEFKYFGSNSTTLRICNPYRLLFKSQNWYLQAYCLIKNEFRFFKLNRMTDVRRKGIKFERGISPKKNTSAYNYAWENVELEFSNKISYLIYDQFPHEDISVTDNQTIVVNTMLPNEKWIGRFLLSFGSNLKKVNPPSVKEAVIKEAEGIIHNLNT